MVIAPERAKRPNDFIIKNEIQPSADPCLFCVGEAAYHNRILHYETQNLYIIPNKYPAFLEDKSKFSSRSIKTENNFYTIKPASGGHDVIIIKNHHTQIYTFGLGIWIDLLQMIKRRYNYWREDANVEYTMAIYNQGIQGGASITHPHAQLFASDIIPNKIIKELEVSQYYYNNEGTCVFCDLVHHELTEKIRIVYENKRFLAFTFYAARFPYEIWILPKIHQSHFESEGHNTFSDLAQCMKNVLYKISRTLQEPALNFYIHDSPPSIGETKYFHWHIEITPRVSNYGGYELGSGVIIDVQSPEEAARYLNS